MPMNTMLPIKVTVQPITFEEHCLSRQVICVGIIDKIITNSPFDALKIVETYNRLEEDWKNFDDLNDFPHEKFVELNSGFKEMLNVIMNNMNI